MLSKIGLVIVFSSTILGYLVGGGDISLFFQFFEWCIIIGISVGSFLISNPKYILLAVLRKFFSFQYKIYTKKDYINLLIFFFHFLRYARNTSLAELEKQVENPEFNSYFQQCHMILNNKEALHFFCDNFRIISLGFDDVNEFDNTMELYIHQKKNEMHQIASAVYKLADALPGIGIVACIIGIIISMGSVGMDPSILSFKIASALVATCIGVFLSYGVFFPMANRIENLHASEIKVFECIKVIILCHLSGYPPSIAVEFARHLIPEDVKPSFQEFELSIHNHVELSFTK